MEIIKQLKTRSACRTLYWLGLEEKLPNESALPEKILQYFFSLGMYAFIQVGCRQGVSDTGKLNCMFESAQEARGKGLSFYEILWHKKIRLYEF